MTTSTNNEDIVLAIILRAPTHAGRIGRETGLTRWSVNAIIGRLSARQAIERVGNCRAAGFKDAKPSLSVWAAPGTPQLQSASRQEDPVDIRIAGRITHGRGSVWGASLV